MIIILKHIIIQVKTKNKNIMITLIYATSSQKSYISESYTEHIETT